MHRMPAFLLAAQGQESLVSGIALVNRVYRYGWIGVVLLVAGCTKGDDIVRSHNRVSRSPSGGRPRRRREAATPRGDDSRRRSDLVLPHVGTRAGRHRIQAAIRRDRPVAEVRRSGTAEVETSRRLDREAPKEAVHRQDAATCRRHEEIAVSTVSKAGATTLPNVNRWRGQLGLPPGAGRGPRPSSRRNTRSMAARDESSISSAWPRPAAR